MINLYYVGRFVIRGKRIDKLLELSNLLEINNCEYNFKIFSEIDLNSEEYRMFENNSKFKFLGFKKDWVNFLEKDDIMIFMTEYEGCPLSILEAYKSNYKNIAVLKFTGIESYLSENCIFNSVEHMSYALLNNIDLQNSIDLSTYFNAERFENEVLDFYRFI